LFGSVERFLGILLEHFAGALPTWLAPVQIAILPIADAQAEYAQELLRRAKARSLRAELLDATSKINYRIREAELQKIPYMLVAGKREVAEHTVSVRTYQEKDRGTMSVDDVLDEVARKTMARTLDVKVKDYTTLFRTDSAAAATQEY
jgi:threonyl-tRNA synthetase